MSTIVFAYDGSIHGDRVARYAIRLARAWEAGLGVVQVDDLTFPLKDETLVATSAIVGAFLIDHSHGLLDHIAP